MDNGDFGVDLEVIMRAVDAADVLIIRFPFMDARLLVDARPNDADPPVVTMVPQASAIEERFRTIKQARPLLPVPDRVLSFQWPRHASVLEAAGVWARIVARLTAVGHPATQGRCSEAWREMLAEERREVRAAIRGDDRYETIWERESSDL